MKRDIVWTDLLRILAAVGVIYIHANIITPSIGYLGGKVWFLMTFLDALARAAVPLFVMMSGYFLLWKEESLKDFFQKRFMRIGIPAFLWISFYYVWSDYWDNNVNLEFIRDMLLSGQIYKHLYFLSIIIGMYLLAPILRVFLKHASRAIQRYAVVLLFLVGMMVHFTIDMFPFIQKGMSFFTYMIIYPGYFLFGAYAKKISKDQPPHRLLYLGAYIFFAVAITILNYYVLKYQWPKPDNIFYFSEYLNPLVVALSLCAFFIWKDVEMVWPILKENTLLRKIIHHLGSCTFGIYLVHMAFIDIFKRFLFADMQTPAYLLWFPSIANTVLTFICSYLVVILLRQIPVLGKYIFGTWKE